MKTTFSKKNGISTYVKPDIVNYEMPEEYLSVVTGTISNEDMESIDL